jgi:hypothetical protein
MQKAEIRSLIKNSLLRLDRTNRWHDNYIDAAIEKTLARLYEEVWRINPNNLQRYTLGFGYTTPISVLTENTTGIKYSTLPTSIIPIQDKASGVRRISTMTQGMVMFLPMDFREMDLVADGSYFDTITSKIGYAVNQTRVEYYNMSVVVEAAGVRMDLIIPFSKYSETDEVKIPEINDLKNDETFVDKVMKILMFAPPPDLTDENVSAELTQKNSQ